ncbi:hypothetical protein CXG81DRAFT_11815 [Caulochytrium protostelioides]|uniref:Prefoldin n=1 Tax=Caulochytrium protostelioides TaxID=1555241 RepID=A0A4P9X971_9FUNG|nr:Prefoldin [Caulochytrium protostelioides]RKP01541.1 hypothetical protein CXG81DRAFT_11815 [Caulochytrium protostelioides]|eukprot:RKP01541.1 hypothetical protein CXG81DRAFT_11815 [Caulochytrium protostelioides]
MPSKLEQEIQTEVEKFQKLQQDYNKLIVSRSQLESQLSENRMVADEFKRMKPDSDASIFKLVGPVLVKQETVEATSNVNKRIEFITNEIKRLDGAIAESTKTQEAAKAAIGKLQQMYQAQMGGPAAGQA